MTAPVRLTRTGFLFGYPVAALRTEARKGRLALIRVAGKDYVTEDAIREMERRCQIAGKAHDSKSAGTPEGKPSGLSETEAAVLALNAAKAISQKLKSGLRPTSPRSTGPTPANVIPFKSGSPTC